ncbi:MAG TPA: EscU/YscU/HrcU family type III secretion system export apparatus switch protein [Thermoanaerobaculia bacterium]|nr:EscU/YscU/HrcU family type III secretion system export apparatus switch protein [Thermoanaerobaculia bacterium]
MSNKTEQPTPKKLRDARKKGDVAFSKDANNVLTYLAGIALVFLTAKGIGHALEDYYRELLALAASDGLLDHEAWVEAVRRSLALSFRLLAPVVFPIAGIGLLLAYAQVGVIFTGESMKPKLDKLNPINQLKNIFSTKGLFEFGKTLVKLGMVFLLGWLTVQGSLAVLLRLGFSPTPAVLSQGAGVAKHFLWTVGLVFVGLGGLDFAFQRWQWKKKLMMTKDEVKREYKESEGDPLIKQERRQIHHEIINQDVQQAVVGADAVVVNPTHLAVAVAYKKGQMAAPKVAIKGRERLAKKIVKLARKHDVPIVRDRILARALFEVDVDAYVPQELYEAVAEVLMFAWRLRREAGGDAFAPGGRL